MRFVGLIDASSTVYNLWRVPNPEAPYPQDYIIDQQGIVRYWADQFDPKAVIETIDRLLATGAQEGSAPCAVRHTFEARPNPTRGIVELSVVGTDTSLPRDVSVFSALGRAVQADEYRVHRAAHGFVLNLRGLPAGVYFIGVPSTPSLPLVRVTLAD